jgi:hypothetical protein
MRIHYALVVTVPDEIDEQTMEWVEQDAEPHDTTLDAKIARWIGGTISDAEEKLEDALPDGWSVSIDGGVSGE